MFLYFKSSDFRSPLYLKRQFVKPNYLVNYYWITCALPSVSEEKSLDARILATRLVDGAPVDVESFFAEFFFFLDKCASAMCRLRKKFCSNFLEHLSQWNLFIRRFKGSSWLSTSFGADKRFGVGILLIWIRLSAAFGEAMSNRKVTERPLLRKQNKIS